MMRALEQNPPEIARHPCFNKNAGNKFGRIHLPVSPNCNIQCRFCKRNSNKRDFRTGGTHSLISPEKAVELVGKALKHHPEIAVAGISGPGDTLASPHAIETFRLVNERFPHLIKCLSTNGLLLKEKAQLLADVGVNAITVMVNAVGLKVVERVCAHIHYNGQYITGESAARWLVMNQLVGITESVKLGMAVKVNTVLIPGVNDGNIADVAKLTAEAGASSINIIPLIPEHEFKDHRPPSCAEIKKASALAGKYLPVFRQCQQCSDDACGIPNWAVV